MRVVVARFERDRAEAEEIWSDVFQLAYQRLEEILALTEPQQRSWILHTARFLVANRGRRSATRRRALDRLRQEPLAPHASSAEEEFVAFVDQEEDRAADAAVRRVLLGLRFEYRQVLILHALGNNGPSIARQVGISHAAVRKRLMLARAEFRRLHPEPVVPDSSRSQR